MADEVPAAPSRAPKVAGGLTVSALIAGAVVSVAPITAGNEGDEFRAYLDQGRTPTICRGHTGPDVHLGMTATKAQCDAWYRADMTKAMKVAIAVTPTLVENRNALMAAGDFVFNAPKWWPSSPMAARFVLRDWAGGCNAFPGYITLYKAPKPVTGQKCRTNPKGVLYCEAKGLVTRRLVEQRLCLTGK